VNITMRIKIDDLSRPQVAELLDEHLQDMRAWSPPESVHALDLERLRQPSITFWTVWDGEDLLACGAIKRLDAGHGELKSMRTARRARGRGAATLLLRHMVEQARVWGLQRLSLETGTTEGFAAAHRLYARHGFVDCGPFADYAPDPFSRFMTCTLTAAVAVRDATVADAPAISALLTSLGYPGTEGFVPDKIAALLQHSDARLLVATDGTDVLGVVSLHFIPQLALPGDFCRISYLCVAEGARSRGVGAVLEAQVLALAKARGCDRIELHCHSRRTDAHRFYARQGYEESPKYLMKLLVPPPAQ
jgi:putative acetyltransferase